jgi:hypothetical protein
MGSLLHHIRVKNALSARDPRFLKWKKWVFPTGHGCFKEGTATGDMGLHSIPPGGQVFPIFPLFPLDWRRARCQFVHIPLTPALRPVADVSRNQPILSAPYLPFDAATAHEGDDTGDIINFLEVVI